MRKARVILTVLAASVAAGVSGCATTASEADTRWTIASGTYSSWFDTAKDVVRESQFELGRVDARAGVVSSASAASAGYATPWLTYGMSSGDAALGGLMHRESRVVRVLFEPADGSEAEDLRRVDGDLTARVVVEVSRDLRPGRQVDTTNIQRTSYWRDPGMASSGLQPGFQEPAGEDLELAAAIAARIRASNSNTGS